MHLEFQAKEPPHAFGIPGQRTPPCIRNSRPKNPLMHSEFQAKEPPNAFGIPGQRTPHAFGNPGQRTPSCIRNSRPKNPPCIRNSKMPPVVGVWIFSGTTQYSIDYYTIMYVLLPPLVVCKWTYSYCNIFHILMYASYIWRMVNMVLWKMRSHSKFYPSVGISHNLVMGLGVSDFVSVGHIYAFLSSH